MGLPAFCPVSWQNGRTRQGSSTEAKAPTKRVNRASRQLPSPGRGCQPSRAEEPQSRVQPCPETPWGAPVAGDSVGRPAGWQDLHVLPGEDAGDAGADRQRCWGWYPESSTSAGCLATGIPQEPPRPHVPASSASSAATALAAEVRPETFTWNPPASPFPLKHRGPGCAGDTLCCDLSLRPVGPHVSAPSLAAEPRPTGKAAKLLDETDIPPQAQLLPPEADKC